MTSTGVEVRTTTPGRVVLGLTANTPATATVAVMTAVARMIEIWRMVLSSQSKHCSPDFFSRPHPAPTAASRHWYLPIRQKKFALRSFGSRVVGCESDDIAGSQRPIDVFDGHSRFLSHMLEGVGRLDRPPNVF